MFAVQVSSISSEFLFLEGGGAAQVEGHATVLPAQHGEDGPDERLYYFRSVQFSIHGSYVFIPRRWW